MHIFELLGDTAEAVACEEAFIYKSYGFRFFGIDFGFAVSSFSIAEEVLVVERHIAFLCAPCLEDALDKLGLTRREANEFIVYWLPLMEQNPYNIISFQTDIYTDAAQLNVNPAPDTLIRVFMAWQASETAVDLPEQELTAPERNGFTVVEWGGTEMKAD